MQLRRKSIEMLQRVLTFRGRQKYKACQLLGISHAGGINSLFRYKFIQNSSQQSATHFPIVTAYYNLYAYTV